MMPVKDLAHPHRSPALRMSLAIILIITVFLLRVGMSGSFSILPGIFPKCNLFLLLPLVKPFFPSVSPHARRSPFPTGKSSKSLVCPSHLSSHLLPSHFPSFFTRLRTPYTPSLVWSILCTFTLLSFEPASASAWNALLPPRNQPQKSSLSSREVEM